LLRLQAVEELMSAMETSVQPQRQSSRVRSLRHGFTGWISAQPSYAPAQNQAVTAETGKEVAQRNVPQTTSVNASQPYRITEIANSRWQYRAQHKVTELHGRQQAEARSNRGRAARAAAPASAQRYNRRRGIASACAQNVIRITEMVYAAVSPQNVRYNIINR